ncbi:hemolysin family protein [bacterium]
MITIIIICLLLSAFFSGSEMVLLSLEKFELRKIAKRPKYKSLNKWIHNPSWFITGILIGNNIVNIAFGTIYSYLILKYSVILNIDATVAGVFAFVTASLLVLFFGEIIPKNIGKSRAKILIKYIYKPLIFFLAVLSPVINTINRIEKLLKSSGHYERSKFTRDDFHKFIIKSRRKGVIKSELEDMLHSFLELKNQNIHEIMIPSDEIEAMNIDKTKNIIDEVSRFGKSRVPVYRDSLDNIIGILYVKDVLDYIFKEQSIVVEKLLRQPLFILPDEKVENVLDKMKSSKIHIAIVSDDGVVKGLVTMEDILEEVTGEILDEYDLRKLGGIK